MLVLVNGTLKETQPESIVDVKLGTGTASTTTRLGIDTEPLQPLVVVTAREME